MIPEDQNQFALRDDIDLTSLVIEGERVLLRAVDFPYAEAIFREFTDEITRYMIPKAADDISETEDFIRASRQGMKEQYDLALVILRKPEAGTSEEEEFLGCCGLHGRRHGRTPELGIWLKKGAHRQGLGRETIVLLSQWALAHLDFDYLIYPVDRANTPSRRIPESMGGVIIEEARMPTMRGTELDEIVFQLTPEAIAAL